MRRRILGFVAILFATASFALAAPVGEASALQVEPISPSIIPTGCTIGTGSYCESSVFVSPVRVQISVSPDGHVAAVCTGSYTPPPTSVVVCKSVPGSTCSVTPPPSDGGAELPLIVGNWHEVISSDGHFSLVCEGMGTPSN